MSKAITAPSKRRKILNFALVTILAIATGIFLGSWYSYSVLATNVDYSNINTSALIDKPEDVIAKVLSIKNPSASQLNNWVNLAKAKGITPKNLTASQNFVLAEYNIFKSTKFWSHWAWQSGNYCNANGLQRQKV